MASMTMVRSSPCSLQSMSMLCPIVEVIAISLLFCLAFFEIFRKVDQQIGLCYRVERDTNCPACSIFKFNLASSDGCDSARKISLASDRLSYLDSRVVAGKFFKVTELE